MIIQETANKVSPPFSERILNTVTTLGHRGSWFLEDGATRGLALVEAKCRDIKIYWLVDPELETVWSAKFFTYGGTVSLALGETLCRFAEGKKIAETFRLTPDEVEAALRDKSDVPATDRPADESFGKVRDLLAMAEAAWPAAQAVGLAARKLAEAKKEGKTPTSLSEEEKAWFALSKQEQIEKIEQVLEQEVRPGLRSDGGDLTVIDIEDGKKLTAKYQGACGSCASSTGGTLAFIEDRLRSKLYQGLEVVPVF